MKLTEEEVVQASKDYVESVLLAMVEEPEFFQRYTDNTSWNPLVVSRIADVIYQRFVDES